MIVANTRGYCTRIDTCTLNTKLIRNYDCSLVKRKSLVMLLNLRPSENKLHCKVIWDCFPFMEKSSWLGTWLVDVFVPFASWAIFSGRGKSWRALRYKGAALFPVLEMQISTWFSGNTYPSKLTTDPSQCCEVSKKLHDAISMVYCGIPYKARERVRHWWDQLFTLLTHGHCWLTSKSNQRWLLQS